MLQRVVEIDIGIDIDIDIDPLTQFMLPPIVAVYRQLPDCSQVVFRE